MVVSAVVGTSTPSISEYMYYVDIVPVLFPE